MSVDASGAKFKKSRRSGNNGACVEVATNLPHIVAIRDSKDSDGPVLVFPASMWAAFLDAVHVGDFD
ncbi:DUF397 domain-containing protein [Actinoplanes sp. NPDC051859]|uniref:DUF397 domain-containing protein n=1 Tax=Actinoplanes sp. NPDC051859 TaxID=3363909 RepID=UPI0037AA58B5